MPKKSSTSAVPSEETRSEELPEIDYSSAVKKLEEMNFVERLWRKDASIWKNETAHTAIIDNSLGWLEVPGKMLDRIPEIENFRDEVLKEGFSNVVLLGMGGSSLAPEVIRTVFQDPKHPRLHVLDTTDPGWISAVLERIELKKTLFIFASKSGGTIEPSSQFKYFWHILKKAGVKKPGLNFAAITDPGTGLERLAAEKKFRKVFLNFPDIGGRFSALSYFGMVPAALCGADIKQLLQRAVAMAELCKHNDIASNPGTLLGAMMGAMAWTGRDKLTLVMPKKLEALSLWIEQLVAESTGKEGKGITPVGLERLSKPYTYQADRFFVRTKLAAAPETGITGKMDEIKKAGHPVYTLRLNDPYDLGGEFFRWETATATAGALLAIDPFDQPNVKEAKDLTMKVLASYTAGDRPEVKPDFSDARLDVYASEALKSGSNAPLTDYEGFVRLLTGAIGEKECVSLLAYLPASPAVEEGLQDLREILKDRTSSATTLSYGPRYLHSSGQLHKGGPDNALYVILTNQAKKDINIMGEKYTFWQLEMAQAIGDFEALDSKNRRVLRIHLKHPFDRSLKYLGERISKMSRPDKEPQKGNPQGEEKDMLKLTAKKPAAKSAAKTKLTNTTEYVVIDYPKNLETITSKHYAVRIGATEAVSMDISIDDQPWQPCRHAVGYWWVDWHNYTPGTHQIVARMTKKNGSYLMSKRRRCKVI